MTSLYGVYCATVIPWKTDLSCDIEELFSHCQDVMKRGCQGIVLFGTMGEGASCSIQERQMILAQLIARGIDASKLIVAIMACSVREAIELAQAADHYHCRATLLAPPFYYKVPSQEGVLDYFRQVIQNCASKVLLYHIPQFTGVPITIEVIEQLCAEFPERIVGFKESSGDLELVKAIARKLAVLEGHENLITAAVASGAVGSISGIANLYPELICRLFAHPTPRDQEEIVAILDGLKQLPFIPAVKDRLETQRGGSWSRVKPPLVSVR